MDFALVLHLLDSSYRSWISIDGSVVSQSGLHNDDEERKRMRRACLTTMQLVHRLI